MARHWKRSRLIWIQAAVALAISLGFCLVYFLFGYSKYETPDDYAMNLIAVGAFNPDMSALLIFENVIYGALLKVLFQLFPTHNMYLFMVIGSNVFAIALISLSASVGLLDDGLARLGCRTRRQFGLAGLKCVLQTALITILVNAAMGREFYIELQFTKNAALYAVAGCAMLASWLSMGASLKNLFWIPAVLYIVLGYWIRAYSLAAVVAVVLMGVGGLALARFGGTLRLIRAAFNREARKELLFFRQKRQILLVLGLICICIAVSAVANKLPYRSQEWDSYAEYNAYRSRLLDFSIPGYKQHADDYEALGIDEMDLHLLSNWIYVDPDKFSMETLKTIASWVDEDPNYRFRLDKNVLLSTLSTIKYRLTDNPLSAAWVLLLVAALCLRREDMVLVHMVMSLGIVIEYYYLGCLGRLPWRVEMLPWIGANGFFAVLLAHSGAAVKPGKPRGGSIIALGMACVCLLTLEFGGYYHLYKNYKGSQFFQEEGSQYAMFTELRQKPENFYLCTTFTNMLPQHPIYIDEKYVGLYDNIYFTGGWTVPVPWSQYVLDRYGIVNPLKSLVENDGNVFLIDNTGLQDEVRQYLEKETGRPVLLEKEDMLHGFYIWKYSYADAEDAATARESAMLGDGMTAVGCLA